MGIVKSLLKRDLRVPDPPVVQPPARRPDPPTPLALLLPDAGGIATYQLNAFPSARAAEFFLDSTLRGHLPEGAVLFWALSWQPQPIGDDNAHAEPLVVINDARKGIVYPFSFADVDSAHEFIRHEMKRGLDLGQVAVYWAVPARIEVDFWGRSTILPPTAPVRTVEADERATTPIEFEPKLPASRLTTTVEEEQAGAETAAETEATEEDERYLTESDIADVVGLMQQISGESRPLPSQKSLANHIQPAGNGAAAAKNGKPANGQAGQLIDFPAASQRLRSREAAVQAWGNISLAIDEALDVYVARQVAVKLAWNRLMRAIGQAIDAQESSGVKSAWQNGARALGDAARADRNRHNAVNTAWVNTGAAMAEAVEGRKRQVAAMALANVVSGVRDGIVTHRIYRARMQEVWAAGTDALTAGGNVSRARKGMRRAWLNISWTMEEAVYAFALEQKAKAILAWRNATTAIAEAAETKERYEAALRLYWNNAGVALFEATETFLARRRMFREVLSHLFNEFEYAARSQRKHEGIVAALDNLAQALEEAFEAKAWREEMIATWDLLVDEIVNAAQAKFRHDGLVLAWGNAAEALDEVCQAYVRKQKRAIRAWGRIATAIRSALEAKTRQDAAIAAWQSITLALFEYIDAKRRHEGLILAWQTAGTFMVEVIAAKKHHDMIVAAWHNAGDALVEAVAEKIRCDGLAFAWRELAYAIGDAVRAAAARQAALERAWARATLALAEALAFKNFRERAISAWRNATLAMAEAGNAYVYQLKVRSAWRNAARALAEAVPLHLRKVAAIEAWTAGSIAIKEAIVAEAKFRIAEAGLDRKVMAEVDRAVKDAQKAMRAAQKNGAKTKGPSLAAATVAVVAPAEQEETEVDEVVEVPEIHEIAGPEEVVEEAVDDEEATKASGEADEGEGGEDGGDAEAPPAVEDAEGVLGLWKTPAGRWEPREEPFKGFNSPRGRFHHDEDGKGKPSL